MKMKGRESGMPAESWWSSFYDVEQALDILMGSHIGDGNIVDFGSGYGTFTLPAALRTSGIVSALDIELELIEQLQKKARNLNRLNIEAIRRDFVNDGTGLEPNSQSHVMIYNLLHIENPIILLREANRILKPSGVVSVMHWRSDIPTPRGPSLTIRPSPIQCEQWSANAGFKHIQHLPLGESCPFHFGLSARKIL